MNLVVGTAQLGLNYGITNSTGKLPTNDAISLLKLCTDKNVLCFDTARAYGDAENLLGNISNIDGVKIYTKLDPINGYENMTDANIIQCVDNSIKLSVDNLRISTINVLLLHRPEHYYFRNKLIWNRLLYHKNVGTIRKLGVSVYNVNEAIDILKDKDIEHIQIPFNMLDSSWFNIEFQNLLNVKKNITVHCRSIFLQGLILADKEKWPKIENVNPEYYVDNITQFAKKFGYSSKIELAVSYVKSMKWINGIIIGVDNSEQLEENIKSFNVRTLNDSETEEIKNMFQNVPRELLNPSLWPKK